MSLYAGAILLTELLMVAMMYHVAYYPGFTRSDYTDPPSSWERRSVYTRWRRVFSPHSA